MTALRTSTASAVLDRAVRSPARDLDDLATLAADVAGSPLLAVLLANLRHDPAALAEVAGRSSWHSNGFAKIVLDADDDPDGRKLRLHVWPVDTAGGGPRGESDPHGHRWDFASVVLAGEGFDVVEYERVESHGEQYGGYEYDPRASEPLRGGIEVLLRPGPVRFRPPRDVYRCSTEIVHTVEPRGRGVAATLVVQGPVTRSSTWVFRREPSGYDVPVALTEDDVISLADLVLVAL